MDWISDPIEKAYYILYGWIWNSGDGDSTKLRYHIATNHHAFVYLLSRCFHCINVDHEIKIGYKCHPQYDDDDDDYDEISRDPHIWVQIGDKEYDTPCDLAVVINNEFFLEEEDISNILSGEDNEDDQDMVQMYNLIKQKKYDDCLNYMNKSDYNMEQINKLWEKLIIEVINFKK